MREAEVKALFIDPVNRTPVVVLKDMHSSKIVPIWIGETEAFSIATELQGQKFARPLSHDLMKSIMEAVGAKLEKVVINDLRDNVYIATVYIKTAAGEIRELDARPSDSIALALRMHSPIYIADHVFDKSAIEPPEDEEEKEKFTEFVDKELRLSEFRRYIDDKGQGGS
ncbi:MAG TPA: bifunctional nuclease family protein [Candidatus Acetothermia bacterium]|nr:bifunctional nuclease family protein [Candidatus Acetothermia bacterium]